MGKRKEVAFEEKVSLVEEYLAGRLRMREAARRAGAAAGTGSANGHGRRYPRCQNTDRPAENLRAAAKGTVSFRYCTASCAVLT